MKVISSQTFDTERALYNLTDALVSDCLFAGPSDGESVLKESRNITVNRCQFSLRYPLWHAQKYEINGCRFNEKSRAPIWYAYNGNINNSEIYSVKAVRECQSLVINNSKIESTEFGWKSSDIKITNTKIVSEYLFLDSKNIEINNIDFKGKYSFQYVENVNINDSRLDTKDAFWHSNGVTVRNSIVKGEYLGWFSNNLTLINCKIIGTQPLCYCKNLKLIDCEMIDTDLSFEYSDVDASIKGHISSIKNPRSGVIKVNSVGEIITSDSIMENHTKIIISNK